MSSSRDDRINERARQIREEEGGSRDGSPENLDPERMEGADADVVRANKEMKDHVGNAGGSDGGLAAGTAASGVRMNSTDRVKHAASGGEDALRD